jgi:predicted RNase H-like HicB family nuclease
MDFPIAIHRDEGSVYGVIVPDIPGCHSWGDTLDDAIRNAKEAIIGHVSTLLELGEDVGFTCSTVEELAGKPEFSGVVWALVDVDLSKLDSKPERINISIPRFVLRKIDAYVEGRHETRSGFLARAALEALAHAAKPRAA